MSKVTSKKVRKIISIVVSALMFLALLFLLFVAIFPDVTFEVFGFKFYLVANTKSMEPDLVANDLIVVVKHDFEQLQVGDVITFWGRNTNGEQIVITHMVNKIYVHPVTNQLSIQTKGVNLPSHDLYPVTADGSNDSNLYIGKCVGKSTFFGNLFAYVASSYGIVSVIVNAIGITLIVCAIHMLRHEAMHKLDQH